MKGSSGYVEPAKIRALSTNDSSNRLFCPKLTLNSSRSSPSTSETLLLSTAPIRIWSSCAFTSVLVAPTLVPFSTADIPNNERFKLD